MIIVGLSGVATAGKDEAATALVNQLGFTVRGYAEALRIGIAGINPIIAVPPTGCLRYNDIIEQYGYNGGKAAFPEMRRLLQAYGTEGARNIFGADIWVKALFLYAETAGIDRLVIPDVRFPNERTAIEDRQGLVFRITRPGLNPVNDHISDNAIGDDEFHPSATITNNREIQDLHKNIVRAVSAAFEI